jgi:hypothetical protein
VLSFSVNRQVSTSCFDISRLSAGLLQWGNYWVGKQSVKDADQQQKTRGDGKGDSSGGVAGVVVVVVNKIRRGVSVSLS